MSTIEETRKFIEDMSRTADINIIVVGENCHGTVLRHTLQFKQTSLINKDIFENISTYVKDNTEGLIETVSLDSEMIYEDKLDGYDG